MQQHAHIHCVCVCARVMLCRLLLGRHMMHGFQQACSQSLACHPPGQPFIDPARTMPITLEAQRIAVPPSHCGCMCVIAIIASGGCNTTARYPSPHPQAFAFAQQGTRAAPAHPLHAFCLCRQLQDQQVQPVLQVSMQKQYNAECPRCTISRACICSMCSVRERGLHSEPTDHHGTPSVPGTCSAL